VVTCKGLVCTYRYIRKRQEEAEEGKRRPGVNFIRAGEQSAGEGLQGSELLGTARDWQMLADLNDHLQFARTTGVKPVWIWNTIFIYGMRYSGSKRT
jgi:hypothetical protein